MRNAAREYTTGWEKLLHASAQAQTRGDFVGAGRDSVGSAGGEFFLDPLLQGVHVLLTAEKVFDQVVGGHGTSGLENGAAIAVGGRLCEKVGAVELGHEILGDHLVIEIGVVGRRVAAEMSEGS